jgi:hypothetical protein
VSLVVGTTLTAHCIGFLSLTSQRKAKKKKTFFFFLVFSPQKLQNGTYEHGFELAQSPDWSALRLPENSSDNMPSAYTVANTTHKSSITAIIFESLFKT